MASTAGLVPITRAYLAKFYDGYPYSPACQDIASLSTTLCDHYRRMEAQLLSNSERDDAGVVASLEFVPPHKIDENLWRNREQIEEILDLLKELNQPAVQNLQTCQTVFTEIAAALRSLLKEVEEYQVRSSEKVFSMVMTYMPQDFRGTLIRQQRERSEKRRQQEVEALISNGGSIHDKFVLLWQQQMDRRRQLAQLGSATGVYKTIVKYLVGVPQVLLDFVRQINDHNGPMEEQRERYGPFLHQLTLLSISIRIFLVLWWKLSDNPSLCTDELLGLIERAIKSYVTEFRHFLTFLGDVFENSPFLISAEEAGTVEGIAKVEEFKETVIATGKTHEVTVTVDCAGSLVAWDFQLTSGKWQQSQPTKAEGAPGLHTNSGTTPEGWPPATRGDKDMCRHTTVMQEAAVEKKIRGQGARRNITFSRGHATEQAMLPYQRYESNQGNFYSPSVGSYKLTWDNSYSTFMRKSLRYKVDAIPPVIEASSLESTITES